MAGASPDFAGEYQHFLKEYLQNEGEEPLHSAYELGRNAMRSGVGVLDVTNVHQLALRHMLAGRLRADEVLRRIAVADRFLLEALSPFEMLNLGNQEVNSALRRLNEILEEEAKRIAHSLHDEAAQLLATVYLELAEIERDVSASVQSRIRRITEHLDQVRQQLRRLSHELRPPILDQLGVLPALRFLADGVSKRVGLQIQVEGTTDGRLPPLIETALYRAVQEALTNVTRHARAKRAIVHVWAEERMVHCTVRDDGVGFRRPHDHDQPFDGLGLVGIRERIGSLHGHFQINAHPGGGTELRVSIPIER